MAVRALSPRQRRTAGVFLEHLCLPDEAPTAGVDRAAALDEVERIVGSSPGLVQRSVRGLLWFLEWGGVLLWAAPAALAAAGAVLAGGWRGAAAGVLLGLPALLWQRPPPGPLSQLPAAWQRAYLRSLAHGRQYTRRMGFKLLAAIVMNAYYGQPAMQRAVGYDTAARVAWSRGLPNPGSVLDGEGRPAGEGLPADRSP